MRRRFVGAFSVGCVVAIAGDACGQSAGAGIGGALAAEPVVRAALESARASEPRTLADQIRLCEIPAPPFREAARGRALADEFRVAGLKSVRVDRQGNVLGERPGLSLHPHVVISAHLDTVFPDGTGVNVSRDGNVLRGPGIGDDCRGLAVLLAIARALDAAKVRTPGRITFVGTVGEEGLGDLRGVRALFHETLKGTVDRFVSIDGPGHGISHIAVGSRRYRITFKGPGGHSYGNFGAVNPIHALAKAIDAMARFQVPANPRTTFNVGRIGGGISVNAIAPDAWMEVDLRSTDPAALEALDTRFHRAVEDALASANGTAAGAGRLTMVMEVVGNRPAARMEVGAPIVAIAVSVTEALGLPVRLDEASTDANVPMSLGIPAIRIEGGGEGGESHSLDEWFNTTRSWEGTMRAVLLAIALAR